jgi:hypothetical protein
MAKPITYVGLDVHKDTIAVALAEAGLRGEVREHGKIPHTPAALKALTVKLAPARRELRFCYEAGPCGYGIQRQLTEAGHECAVVAPSLIPRKPGLVKCGKSRARFSVIAGFTRIHAAIDTQMQSSRGSGFSASFTCGGRRSHWCRSSNLTGRWTGSPCFCSQSRTSPGRSSAPRGPGLAANTSHGPAPRAPAQSR